MPTLASLASKLNTIEAALRPERAVIVAHHYDRCGHPVVPVPIPADALVISLASYAPCPRCQAPHVKG